MSDTFIALVIAMLPFGFVSFLIMLYLTSIEEKLVKVKAELDAMKVKAELDAKEETRE